MNDDATLGRPADSTETRDSPNAFQAPLAIPNIQFVSRIGRGGMAVVWKGLDTYFMPPRPVAIKLMDPEISQNPDFSRRFDSEASIMAGFRHENIVTVHAAGELNGTKYIVMEHLEGGTLAEKLESSGALPAETSLRTMAKLAGALAYAHSLNVVHRDFKPSNVLFTRDGNPVLADFGVAKVVPRRKTSQGGTVVGTPGYMSPEQAIGDTPTDRSDIYSLGITLFETLTGRKPPLRGISQTDETSVDEIRSLLPPLPSGVAPLVSECLRAQASARPSAAECQGVLATAADAVQRDRISERRPVPPLQRWRRILFVAAFAALATATAWLVLRDRPDLPPPSTSQGTATVAILRDPASADIYVDGRRQPESTLQLESGKHDFAAIARGHYGELKSVVIGAEPLTNVRFELLKTRLPDREETARFLTLADAKEITAADVSGLSEPTIRTALQAKLLLQSQRFKELAELTDNIRTLGDLGDERSAITLALAQGMRTGTLSQELLTPQIVSASDNGDALASFIIAIAYRGALVRKEAPIDYSSAGYIEYCRRLALAAMQGWGDVVNPYLRTDACRP